MAMKYIRSFFIWIDQWRCTHEFPLILNTVAVEDWQKPEQHPHPRFRSYKIQRQKIIGGSICPKCGKLNVVIGHNQKDAPPEPMRKLTKSSTNGPAVL